MASKTAHETAHKMAHKTVHKMVHKTVHKMAHKTAHKMAHKMARPMRLGMAQVSARETVLLMGPSTKLGIRLSPMTPMTSAMWTGHGIL